MAGIPTAMVEPTRPLPTLPSRRTHSTSERKHDRQSRPPRPPSGDRPSSPGSGKPNICDGNFNTVAFFRREMFVFKVGVVFSLPVGYPMPVGWFHYKHWARSNPGRQKMHAKMEDSLMFSVNQYIYKCLMCLLGTGGGVVRFDFIF